MLKIIDLSKSVELGATRHFIEYHRFKEVATEHLATLILLVLLVNPKEIEEIYLLLARPIQMNWMLVRDRNESHTPVSMPTFDFLGLSYPPKRWKPPQ